MVSHPSLFRIGGFVITRCICRLSCICGSRCLLGLANAINSHSRATPRPHAPNPALLNTMRHPKVDSGEWQSLARLRLDRHRYALPRCQSLSPAGANQPGTISTREPHQRLCCHLRPHEAEAWNDELNPLAQAKHETDLPPRARWRVTVTAQDREITQRTSIIDR